MFKEPTYDFLEGLSKVTNILIMLCSIGILLSSNSFMEALLLFFVIALAFSNGFAIAIMANAEIQITAKEDNSND